ncbi:Nephrocystin-3 [Penicillium rolfsii]|nr:Nephrocystin-3 [Penicillium rolfsii]
MPCDPSQAHYVIPSMENRHFTGRESMLDDLKNKLFLQANTEKLAIYGLGGIGKTQVALQLAHWVKAHVPDCSIFWAPALSLESFEQACAQIAKELKIYQNTDGESAMEMVNRQLSSDEAGKWLFIVDNADDLDLLSDELDQYFPASKSGVILLTTRSREVAMSFAGRDIVELQKMTTEEGIAFFTKVVGEESLCGKESTIQLLEELNFLPLAISQAAYYICRNDGTTKRYLESMRKNEQNRMRLASRNFHDSTRYRKIPNAVTTTWLISFNQIKGYHPSAADLLEFMSYLEPKAIPRSVLPTLDSEEEMEFAIGTLCNYGFLTRRDSEDMFDMHSLVQLSTRMWMTDSQKTQQIITTVTQHMARCFPSDEYTNREKWRIYLPHALQILRREESSDISERYSLLSKVGKCVLADGRPKEAVNLLREVYAWSQNHHDEEHPYRLASQHDLALAYESDGQIKQAVELFKHVVAVRERTLDEEHLDRLRSQHALAGAYHSNGQFKQAVELLKHVVAVHKRTLDEAHPDRLASQHELAGAFHSNGQFKQAVELLKHVVAVHKRTLDEAHPDRLASQHELAGAHRSNGHIKQAIELIEHVVVVKERTLDEEHPSRLRSQAELARAYHANGQIKQAIELLKHVVAVHERTLDEAHSDRLAPQHELAGVYHSDGQIKQAIELLEYLVVVKERTLDEEHPSRLRSQAELARAYHANGQIKQAIELLKHVVAVHERTLDEAHSDRLAPQHELAGVYHSDGQIKQAIELLEYLVVVKERTLDEEHPSRLASQHELAGAYQSNGQIKQAIELFEHVVAVKERTFDEENPSRLASQHELAGSYHSNGQIKQAVELLEHVVSVHKRTLDEEHPYRLASQHELARAYRSNGQTKQAMELLEHVVAVKERAFVEEHPDRLASEHALRIVKQSIKEQITDQMLPSSPTNSRA